MKLSESWLRTWVNPTLNSQALCETLTMAGLEIESLTPVADKFSGVVVAQVVTTNPHPDADRLKVCEVDVGAATLLTIVCGASNVKPGMKVAAALNKAVLSNQMNITISQIRGVTSNGMLCSAKELGLAEESEGLMPLPQDAPLGKDVWEYLHLNDHVIDVGITPNRGDCLSVWGMALEVSALTECEITLPELSAVPASIADVLPVTLKQTQDCPHYVGRVIRKVNASQPSPLWLQEKLRRSGHRSISAIVDVMNYVMLELGQPMHAFDLHKIKTEVVVRLSKSGEQITLLDDSEVTLNDNTLVICDQKTPIAIAGVMGGLDSAVTDATQDIFLESAYFNPQAIARAARHYHLSSDSAYRFERGIDPEIQALAIERATQLILEIVGGEAGPLIDVVDEKTLPTEKQINLRDSQLKKALGCLIPDETVENILRRLGFSVKKSYDAFCWIVTVPARRSDITIEADLVEEIARIYGYANIPSLSPLTKLEVIPCPETEVPLTTIRQALVDMGYQEVITYSFVDKKLQETFSPNTIAKELVNPITADMNVMRTNLFPGLVNTFLYNQNRQQTRIRIFETGLRFVQADNDLLQQKVLSGLVSGSALPEQWGAKTCGVDFFDVKGDLENLFQVTLEADKFDFRIGRHPGFHPGQTADIFYDGEIIGKFGALHPSLTRVLKIDEKVFLFELLLEKLEVARLPGFKGLSKFPEIRRDLALVIDQAIPSHEIRYTIKTVTGELLQAVNIFDVYQGKGIEPGRKSIALALTLQHASRTLVDEEVADLMERVVASLTERYNAELRG